MRNDLTLLLDMLLSAEKRMSFSADLTQVQFEASELVQSAVIREIQVIGEAARLVSDQTKQAYPEINWASIAGMRNSVVHEYFRIDLEILWDALQDDIPVLVEQLKPLIPRD